MKTRALILTGIALLLATAAISEPVRGRLQLLLSSNPVAATPASIGLGRVLFEENCMACHGDTGAGDGELAKDIATPPANLRGLDRPPSVLAMRIAYGVGTDMPPWNDTLSEAELWTLVTYVSSLSRDGQPRQRRSWRPFAG